MKDYKWDKIFKPLIIKYRPKTFCEIGCHEGLTLKSLTPLTKDIGYKIDYQFDPINDPINPPFRCIPALKDINDGMAGKILAMANNPSAGVDIMAEGRLPGFGGRRRGKRRRNNKTVNGTTLRSRTQRHGYGHGHRPRRHTRRH